MKTILLIEDNPALMENTSEILELENFRVIPAQNGEKAIALLEECKPDLIISDVLMPGLNGYDVLKAVKSIPSLSEIPFIFLSSKSEKVDVKLGLELGADTFLTKPFDPDELIRIVKKILHKKTPEPSGTGALHKRQDQ